MEMNIVCRSTVYRMDAIAVRELQAVKCAGDANEIFERFAPHVPRYDRLHVWLAADDAVLPQAGLSRARAAAAAAEEAYLEWL